MKKTLLLFLFVTLVSCNQKEVVREINKDFAENRWQATNIKTFGFTLTEDIAAADVKLLFSHIYNPGYETVPVSVILEGPTGEKENIYLNLRLKDAKGNDLSECAGDVCDLYTNFKDNIALAKGNYKITVQNKFANAYLPNMLSVGITVQNKH